MDVGADLLLSLIASSSDHGIAIGSRVRLRGRKGVCVGTVRHVGAVHFGGGEYIGVDLDQAIGQHDGTIDNITYFSARPRHGIFVTPMDVELVQDGDVAAGGSRVPTGQDADGELPVPSYGVRSRPPAPPPRPAAPVAAPRPAPARERTGSDASLDSKGSSVPSTSRRAAVRPGPADATVISAAAAAPRSREINGGDKRAAVAREDLPASRGPRDASRTATQRTPATAKPAQAVASDARGRFGSSRTPSTAARSATRAQKDALQSSGGAGAFVRARARIAASELGVSTERNTALPHANKATTPSANDAVSLDGTTSSPPTGPRPGRAFLRRGSSVKALLQVSPAATGTRAGLEAASAHGANLDAPAGRQMPNSAALQTSDMDVEALLIRSVSYGNTEGNRALQTAETLHSPHAPDAALSSRSSMSPLAVLASSSVHAQASMRRPAMRTETPGGIRQPLSNRGRAVERAQPAPQERRARAMSAPRAGSQIGPTGPGSLAVAPGVRRARLKPVQQPVARGAEIANSRAQASQGSRAGRSLSASRAGGRRDFVAQALRATDVLLPAQTTAVMHAPPIIPEQLRQRAGRSTDVTETHQVGMASPHDDTKTTSRMADHLGNSFGDISAGAMPAASNAARNASRSARAVPVPGMHADEDVVMALIRSRVFAAATQKRAPPRQPDRPLAESRAAQLMRGARHAESQPVPSRAVAAPNHFLPDDKPREPPPAVPQDRSRPNDGPQRAADAPPVADNSTAVSAAAFLRLSRERLQQRSGAVELQGARPAPQQPPHATAGTSTPRAITNIIVPPAVPDAATKPPVVAPRINDPDPLLVVRQLRTRYGGKSLLEALVSAHASRALAALHDHDADEETPPASVVQNSGTGASASTNETPVPPPAAPVSSAFAAAVLTAADLSANTPVPAAAAERKARGSSSSRLEEYFASAVSTSVTNTMSVAAPSRHPLSDAIDAVLAAIEESVPSSTGPTSTRPSVPSTVPTITLSTAATTSYEARPAIPAMPITPAHARRPPPLPAPAVQPPPPASISTPTPRAASGVRAPTAPALALGSTQFDGMGSSSARSASGSLSARSEAAAPLPHEAESGPSPPTLPPQKLAALPVTVMPTTPPLQPGLGLPEDEARGDSAMPITAPRTPPLPPPGLTGPPPALVGAVPPGLHKAAPVAASQLPSNADASVTAPAPPTKGPPTHRAPPAPPGMSAVSAPMLAKAAALPPPGMGAGAESGSAHLAPPAAPPGITAAPATLPTGALPAGLPFAPPAQDASLYVTPAYASTSDTATATVPTAPPGLASKPADGAHPFTTSRPAAAEARAIPQRAPPPPPPGMSANAGAPAAAPSAEVTAMAAEAPSMADRVQSVRPATDVMPSVTVAPLPAEGMANPPASEQTRPSTPPTSTLDHGLVDVLGGAAATTAAAAKLAVPPQPFCVVRSYAGICEQGFSSASPEKPNQDAIIMAEHPESDALMLAVFDGHGEDGHEISGYFRDHLADAVFGAHQYNKFVEVADNIAPADGDSASTSTPRTSTLPPVAPPRTRRDVAGALKHGLSLCEKAVLTMPQVDCSLSGCTGCVVVVTGNEVTVANVGDSRCVLLRHADAAGDGALKLLHKTITIDHKPTLPSETRRILLTGGRVQSIRYEDGGEGPVRVWLRDDDVPGLAMSRSLGDTIGKKAGVSSMPDIYTYTLTTRDAYVVVASDGLWEFTSLPEVAKLVEQTHAEAVAAQQQYDAAVAAGVEPAGEPPAQHLQLALDALANIANAHWHEREGVMDDLSIILAEIGSV